MHDLWGRMHTGTFEYWHMGILPNEMAPNRFYHNFPIQIFDGRSIILRLLFVGLLQWHLLINLTSELMWYFLFYWLIMLGYVASA
jgi:hypothetical protein